MITTEPVKIISSARDAVFCFEDAVHGAEDLETAWWLACSYFESAGDLITERHQEDFASVINMLGRHIRLTTDHLKGTFEEALRQTTDRPFLEVVK